MAISTIISSSVQIAGKKVAVRYPDSHDCSAYELGTAGLMVRTHNLSNMEISRIAIDQPL
jgi:hypothetical protein